MRRCRSLGVLATALTLLPAMAAAETMNFKILTNYSQASFRNDAPLETFVGTSALDGIQGNLTVERQGLGEGRHEPPDDGHREA
jgi:hypothetical protein